MFCILIYDIATENEEDNKRLQRVYEITRKYLEHVEFSVFYGEINKKLLKKLIKEIEPILDRNRDSVIIYLFKSRKDIKAMVKFGIEEKENII